MGACSRAPRVTCGTWERIRRERRRRCALDVLVIPADTGLVGRFLFFHRRASKDPDRTHVHVLVRARVSPMWRARVEAAARGLAYQQYRATCPPADVVLASACRHCWRAAPRIAGFTGSVRFGSVRYKQFSNPPAHRKRENNAGERVREN